MAIKRKPKKWRSQQIFFDIVRFNRSGVELSRRASFLCKNCRHICEYCEDSKCFRCECCGKKLTLYGAKEILERYVPQLTKLKNIIEKLERKEQKK